MALRGGRNAVVNGVGGSRSHRGEVETSGGVTIAGESYVVILEDNDF